MRRSLIKVLLVLVISLASAVEARKASKGVAKVLAKEEEKVTDVEAEDEVKGRKGKVFSLFNVIHFQNGGCKSQSSFGSTGISGSNRDGTCFTSEQCSDKGGTASGNCAAGFGVCCVFLVSASGATVDQNCTYIRNPGFPTSFTLTSDTTYTIKKMSDNICKLRLDFETFTIQGTGDTEEGDEDSVGTDGQCRDTFDVTVKTGQNIPTICGINTGQHMYIDIGNEASDTATLSFTFGDAQVEKEEDATGPYTGNRLWEIKVSQIPCYGCCANCYQAPPGCLQYHTGLTGTLSTFNYAATDDNHLRNQDYNICIRQEAGYCCIQYAPCAADGELAFSIDTQAVEDITEGTSEIDSSCTGDYIAIAGSNANCNQGGSRVPVVNKYCGNFFNAIAELEVSSTVCDCTQPFNVQIHTDALPDSGDIDEDNDIQSRGVCLTWTQIPCAS